MSSVRVRATAADTSDFRAHVKYQKDRVERVERVQGDESVIDQHLGELLLVPDPLKAYPMIGYDPEVLIDLYEERTAILEYDAGMPRRDAEARAFSACLAIACGADAGVDHLARALDHLKAIGLTPPSGWPPAR